MAHHPPHGTHWPTLGVRPPRADSGQRGRRRFVRDVELRYLVLIAVPLVLILLVLVGGVALLIAAIATAVLLANAVWLTYLLSRDPGR